jgi:hypothetical protein
VPQPATQTPVFIYDARGRLTVVSGGQASAPQGMSGTLTGDLAGPGGQPLSGSLAADISPLIDLSGQPIPPSAARGPVIVDLQAGTPSFLQRTLAERPGARGIGIESGDWILGYQGINPTHPQDLALARLLARNSPIWPNTPASLTPFRDIPGLFPWEIDPARYLFPRSGAVSILPEPFFSPFGGEVSPGVRRLIPYNIRDVAGIQPTVHPSVRGVASEIYLRRPFGLASADAPTTAAMGQELNSMLRQGGFVEFRLRAQTEFSVPTEGAGGVDQLATVVSQIEGARVVRVDRGMLQRFQRTGQIPPDASPAQAEILRNAASDIQGLGQGAYVRIIRIYKGASPQATSGGVQPVIR